MLNCRLLYCRPQLSQSGCPCDLTSAMLYLPVSEHLGNVFKPKTPTERDKISVEHTQQWLDSTSQYYYGSHMVHNLFHVRDSHNSPQWRR